MDEIRQKWEQKVAEIIDDCISQAKTIDEIKNPWIELEKQRLKIADEFGNNYPAQIEAQTAALLLIEKGLSDKFSDEYIKFCQSYPEEVRGDFAILMEAGRLVNDVKKDKDPSQINKQAVYDVWFKMLNEHEPFLLAKVKRNTNGVSTVVKRSDEELKKFIDDAL